MAVVGRSKNPVIGDGPTLVARIVLSLTFGFIMVILGWIAWSKGIDFSAFTKNLSAVVAALFGAVINPVGPKARPGAPGTTPPVPVQAAASPPSPPSLPGTSTPPTPASPSTPPTPSGPVSPSTPASPSASTPVNPSASTELADNFELHMGHGRLWAGLILAGFGGVVATGVAVMVHANPQDSAVYTNGVPALTAAVAAFAGLFIDTSGLTHLGDGSAKG